MNSMCAFTGGLVTACTLIHRNNPLVAITVDPLLESLFGLVYRICLDDVDNHVHLSKCIF